MRFAPFAALLIAAPAYAAEAPAPAAPSLPTPPVAAPAVDGGQVRPAPSDYDAAQTQTLVDTVQYLTRRGVELGAQLSATRAELQKERARSAELARKLADATKSTPEKPADWDASKAPAEPAKPDAAKP